MGRNEVLERLDAAGEPRGPIEYEMVRKDLLRASAEFIRAGGWRPIAEAPEGRPVTCGKHTPRGGDWLVYRFFSAAHAAKEGYTHYLPEPEPPAREDSKAKNGE